MGDGEHLIFVKTLLLPLSSCLFPPASCLLSPASCLKTPISSLVTKVRCSRGDVYSSEILKLG